jgi:hypothetical protein
VVADGVGVNEVADVVAGGEVLLVDVVTAAAVVVGAPGSVWVTVLVVVEPPQDASASALQATAASVRTLGMAADHKPVML